MTQERTSPCRLNATSSFCSDNLQLDNHLQLRKKARSLVRPSFLIELVIRNESLVDVAFPNPVGMELFATWLVGAFVGMSTEVIALSLQQIGWKGCSTVSIKVG